MAKIENKLKFIREFIGNSWYICPNCFGVTNNQLPNEGEEPTTCGECDGGVECVHWLSADDKLLQNAVGNNG